MGVSILQSELKLDNMSQWHHNDNLLYNSKKKISNGIWTNVASNWVNGCRKNGNFWDDWVVLSSAESGWVRQKGKLPYVKIAISENLG